MSINFPPLTQGNGLPTGPRLSAGGAAAHVAPAPEARSPDQPLPLASPGVVAHPPAKKPKLRNPGRALALHDAKFAAAPQSYSGPTQELPGFDEIVRKFGGGKPSEFRALLLACVPSIDPGGIVANVQLIRDLKNKQLRQAISLLAKEAGTPFMQLRFVAPKAGQHDYASVLQPWGEFVQGFISCHYTDLAGIDQSLDVLDGTAQWVVEVWPDADLPTARRHPHCQLFVQPGAKVCWQLAFVPDWNFLRNTLALLEPSSRVPERFQLADVQLTWGGNASVSWRNAYSGLQDRSRDGKQPQSPPRPPSAAQLVRSYDRHKRTLDLRAADATDLEAVTPEAWNEAFRSCTDLTRAVLPAGMAGRAAGHVIDALAGLPDLFVSDPTRDSGAAPLKRELLFDEQHGVPELPDRRLPANVRVHGLGNRPAEFGHALLVGNDGIPSAVMLLERAQYDPPSASFAWQPRVTQQIAGEVSRFVGKDVAGMVMAYADDHAELDEALGRMLLCAETAIEVPALKDHIASYHRTVTRMIAALKEAHARWKSSGDVRDVLGALEGTALFHVPRFYLAPSGLVENPQRVSLAYLFAVDAVRLLGMQHPSAQVLLRFMEQLKALTPLVQRHDESMFSYSTGSRCVVPQRGVTYYDGETPLEFAFANHGEHYFKIPPSARLEMRMPLPALVCSDDAFIQRVRALAFAMASCRTSKAVRLYVEEAELLEPVIRADRKAAIWDLLQHMAGPGTRSSARALGNNRSRIELKVYPGDNPTARSGLHALVSAMPGLRVLALERLTQDTDLSSLPLPEGCAVEVVDASGGHTLTVPPGVECYCRVGASWATPTWIRVSGSPSAPAPIEHRPLARESKGSGSAAAPPLSAPAELPASFEGAVFAALWIGNVPPGSTACIESPMEASQVVQLGAEQFGKALACVNNVGTIHFRPLFLEKAGAAFTDFVENIPSARLIEMPAPARPLDLRAMKSPNHIRLTGCKAKAVYHLHLPAGVQVELDSPDASVIIRTG